MYIGKYSTAQLISASVLDGQKVRFGFIGGVIAVALLYLFKGLSFVLGATGIAASGLEMLGSLAFGLTVSITLLGLTAAIHAGFSAKKKTKTSLFQMGKEQFLSFIGISMLYALITLILLAIEYGIYLIGGTMVFGPILLGLATPALLMFNFVAIFVLVVGLKLLPAYLVSEKGSIVDAVKTLSTRIYKNMATILVNMGLLIITVIPCVALLSALVIGSFMSVIMVDRLVLQQAFYSGGFTDLPMTIFAVLAGLGFGALTLLAVTYVVLYMVAGLYSIYSSLAKK